MEIQGKTIVFLGDSITQGVGASSEKNVFHQITARNFNLKSAINFGISGTRIAKQTKFYNQFYDLYFELREDIMPRDVDAVFVFGGTNDYGHGDAKMGEEDSVDVYTFCGALNSLILKLKKDYSGKEIIFMTPMHRTNETEPSAPENKVLEDYVIAMRNICKKHNIKLIDAFENLNLDPKDKDYFGDGLHPTDKDHFELGMFVGNELLKI